MNTKNEKLQAITKQLENGVKAVFNSDKFREFLEVSAKFHHYSLRNQMLIAMQCPTATRVAGFKAWQKDFGRYVKKGEKGLNILAPCPRKITKTSTNENGEQVEQEVVIPNYRVVTVFDVSQTDGQELPQICNRLTDEVQDFGKILAAIKAVAPCPVEFEKIENGAAGYFMPGENRIAICEGLGELQTIKTAVHELAHSILHNFDALDGKQIDEKPDKNTKEVQAEAVAFTVCQFLGLDTSEYSFEYVASWSSDRELKELQQSLEIIRNAAANIIDGLEYELKAA